MFKIGQFAQIAKVSSRQLRHYDHLGLLRPSHTDPQSGYRYYSMRELPRLNRILALKELGLSLEQIGPLLEDQISPLELRGMLTMKRAHVEQSLHAEEIRLRHIESRIAQIDREGRMENYDVVVKSVAATPFLSLRRSFESVEEVASVVQTVAAEGARQLRSTVRGKLMVVARNDDDVETLDLEIGFALTRQSDERVHVSGGGTLVASLLPAVATMATIVRQGTNVESHSWFATIGLWIEANNYEVAGPCREVFLESIGTPHDFERALVEIQFPVQRGVQ